ncbi:MAG: ATP-binding cassette domain-containing protein, partial [Candidatus Helarchaeota archaeon]
MSEDQLFLEVQELTKEFVRGEPAIKNISFTIKEGHSFGILGKSGSGKSVLMNAIRGTKDYEPTRGKIIYHVSVCPNENCMHINYPSKAGKECPLCGSTLEYKKIDFWEEKKNSTPLSYVLYNRIAIMFQRTFGIFGEITVTDNLKRILKKINYPEKLIDRKAAELI